MLVGCDMFMGVGWCTLSVGCVGHVFAEKKCWCSSVDVHIVWTMVAACFVVIGFFAIVTEHFGRLILLLLVVAVIVYFVKGIVIRRNGCVLERGGGDVVT